MQNGFANVIAGNGILREAHTFGVGIFKAVGAIEKKSLFLAYDSV